MNESFQEPTQTGTTSIPGLTWSIFPEMVGLAKISDGMVMAIIHQKSGKIVKNVRLSYRAQGEVPTAEIGKILNVVRTHLADVDWTASLNELLRDKSIVNKMQSLDTALKNTPSKIEHKILAEELEGGLIWNSRRDEQWWKRRIPVSFDQPEKVFEDIDLPVGAELFSPDMIKKLQSSFGTINRVDPASPTIKKLRDRLDAMSPEMLKQLANANIKFLSIMANSALRSLKEDVAANHAGGDPNPNIAGFDEPAMKKKRDRFAGCEVFEVDGDTFHKSTQGKPKWARYKNYMSLEDYPNVGPDIKEYAKRNPGKNIILKEKTTGRMLYLKGFKH